jgi:RimJ/RimL family protein N-acetyltransferase
LHAGASTTEEQETWINTRPQNEINYIIELPSGEAIGTYSIYKIDVTNLNAETGRLLITESEKSRNIPAAFEAIRLINELAFEKLGLKKIYGTVAQENSGALKLQRLIGMKEEGRLRHHVFINGKFQDILYFGLLADEYYNAQKKKIETLINLFH